MFQHILIPVDFSEKNEQALQVAVEIAIHHHSKISLLHVIEAIADTSFEEVHNFYLGLEERAQKKMDGLLANYLKSAINFEERIVYGNRTQQIIDFSETQAIDLIVMSSHRVDPDDPTLDWGTISYKVGILAPCPILLVK